jgi:acetyl-CoA acetyltransferase
MNASRPDDIPALGLRDRCAVVGIGATEFSRDSGRSALTLATEASLAAIADAGLAPQDIDGIIRCTSDTVSHNALGASLGVRELNFWGETGPGGVAPCAMLGMAAGAILSGQAKTLLLYRSLNGRSEVRFGAGQNRSGAQVVGGLGSYDELFLPYGLATAGQMFALIAQRHMLQYGTTAEQLGALALLCRENANGTPHAQMHDRALTMDDYLGSRFIAKPLRLFDFCLETDGACAVVVTAADRAADMPHPSVLIRAVGLGSPPDLRGGMMFPSLMRDDITVMPGYIAARRLWSDAGLGPHDIDVAQIYDCFTISLLLQLEAYGLCDRGEGGPFAASGALRRDGAIPINTAGGNMSEGYIHGMNHILEAVRQLRGAAAVQIAGAETCLVTGGPLPIGSSAVLRRA